MEATVAATFSQQRPRFHKLVRTRPWVATANHDVRVPGVYLTSAFLAFLYFLSGRRMNNLRVCNGLDGLIPTVLLKALMILLPLRCSPYRIRT